MRDEFVDYLGSIGVTQTAMKRVIDVYNFYKPLCPEEITGIFVTDFINDEGRREYENLWFFSDSLVMEAKRFLTAEEFDMVPFRNSVARWEIKKQDYDFERATDESRFSLEFSIGEVGIATLGAEFRASKENCDFLKDIFLKYVVPNVKDVKPVQSQEKQP